MLCANVSSRATSHAVCISRQVGARGHLCDHQRANKIYVDVLLEIRNWLVQKRASTSYSGIINETTQCPPIQSSPDLHCIDSLSTAESICSPVLDDFNYFAPSLMQ